MGNRPKGLSSTPFGRAAVPRPAQAMNVSDRILGQNKRKQKLSMASGTNPAKEGDKGIPDAPRAATAGGAGGPGGYAQDTAPHKAAAAGNKFDFGVGGPGFPKPWK